jgi:hypothetical protein
LPNPGGRCGCGCEPVEGGQPAPFRPLRGEARPLPRFLENGAG